MSIFDPSKWSDEELAAQCVIPKLEINRYISDEKYASAIEELISLGVCGFCVFGGSPGNVRKVIEKLQVMSKAPLIFCADFENGLPMRLSGGTEFPHAMAFGREGSMDSAFKASRAIAKESKSIGVMWNLAPVCDINSNPANPIINIRSFGETAEIVNPQISTYIKGMQIEKVLACAKHFPGHGDTETDSHIEFPIINKSLNELEKLELIPFENAVKANVKCIMAGHIMLPQLDKSLPASLSPKILKSLLREKIGFDGIIITDALDMKAISNRMSGGEAAIKALTAGADVALMPEDPKETVEFIAKSIKSNKELKNNLLKSSERIISAKKWCGAYSVTRDMLDLNSIAIEHEKMALNVAAKSLKINGDKSLLPISEEIRFAGFAAIQSEDITKPSNFYKFLAQAVDNDCDFGFIDTNISSGEVANLKEKIQGAELFIFTFFYKAAAYQGSLGFPNEYRRIIKDIAGDAKKIAIFFGDPYIGPEDFADAFIYAYSDSLPSIAAVIMKLAGRETNEEN